MFEIIHKIGKGSSGYVYKAINKKDKNIYAIKQSLSPDNDELIKNEITIYQKFKNECPNIIHFYDYFKANNESGQTCLCMQIEYCQYGSIREIIKKGKKKGIFINELEISAIIYMVLKSLVFIHKNNLIDRDIKGRNILVDKEGIIKLCDFGICKPYHKNKMKNLRGGSPYWMAPEVLNKEEYDQTIDIWALGITCIELAEHEPPYFKLSPKEVMKQIIKSPAKGLNNKLKWSLEFNDFISSCLNIDRFKRPSAEELLKHDFITNLEKKNLNRKLVILQFLSKCGYKILYNRKIKITPLSNGNLANYNNKILYHKKGLVDIRKKKGKLFCSQIGTNSKNYNNKTSDNFEHNRSSNKISDNETKQKRERERERRISLNSSGVFAKKVFMRCRSMEKEIDKFENRIRNNNSLKTNLIYKRNNKILNTSTNDHRPNGLNGYKHYLTLENNSINSTSSINNVSNKNLLYDNTLDKKNQFLKNFLKEKNLGREIGDNFNEKKEEVLEEEDEDDEDDKKEKDKILDDEIKELLKQRDIEINNIMLKYQDKMDKMKKEQNRNTIEK